LQTLWPRHHGSVGGLLSKIEAALTAGIDQVGLYNLGLAPESTLAWTRQVASLVAHARG
jgi:hypothetical protein